MLSTVAGFVISLWSRRLPTLSA